jgi:hypothetical protein
VNTKEAEAIRKKRVALIQPLVDKGLKPQQISDEIGINAETIRHIIRRWCVRPEGYLKPMANQEACLMDWDSECDPSNLTDEQRQHAKRVGMTEGRYAWLMTCPKGMHHEIQNKQQTL